MPKTDHLINCTDCQHGYRRCRKNNDDGKVGHKPCFELASGTPCNDVRKKIENRNSQKDQQYSRNGKEYNLVQPAGHITVTEGFNKKIAGEQERKSAQQDIDEYQYSYIDY